ncbi:MAG: hypothetical protein PHX51_03490 [Clostridia bacterium]|nr:hypothetical protein [Clostridia bacterium]
MIDVIMSVNTGSESINMLFGETGTSLKTATLFKYKLPPYSCINGYVDHSKIFTNAFNELLFVNKIYEANIYLCLPSTDLCMDYITVPANVSGGKKDAFVSQELSSLFGDELERVRLNTAVLQSTKAKTVYMYCCMGSKTIEEIQQYISNTNHTLVGITTNGLAIACLALKSNNALNRDAVYFMDVGENNTEMMLLYNGEVVASHNFSYGTNLLANYLPNKSALNKGEITQALRPLQLNVTAFIEATDSLMAKAPVKCMVNQSDAFFNMAALFNSNSTVMFERFVLPSQYKIYPNNLELASAFMHLVRNEYNFIAEEKQR